jgi:hypothetical protein
MIALVPCPVAMAGTPVEDGPHWTETGSLYVRSFGSIPQPPGTHSHAHLGRSWWEKAEWFYGGVGWGGKLNYSCHCPNFGPAHDYFARAFLPETQHYSVGVLDSMGNLVPRIGRYGNVDDGVPLSDSEPRQPHRRAIGGDEVALAYACYAGTHSDRYLFIYDAGNDCIRSVTLGYHESEVLPLQAGRDARKGG